MPLASGSRLGPYEVVAPLGAGGMGEVYRARDARLARDVAIKILPEAVAGDPERLRRFEREAKALAALNHPHIAQVYGFEERPPTGPGQAPLRALVMELVPGESLEARLLLGPVPVRESLELARQIADGLAAAHDKGIVHRDLKPANLQRTPDGTLKILDFGLAKAVTPQDEADAAEGPTATGQTRHGVVMGTAAYMSPEQARGLAVDARTDVWAFGCVLYELLAGARVFPGATQTDVLAAVLEREPDWTKLPESTPAAVRTLLRRCLNKDARQRLHHVADARFDLEEGLVALSGPTAPAAGPGATPPPAMTTSSLFRRVVRATALVAALAAVAVAGWLVGSRRTAGPTGAGVARLSLSTESALGVAGAAHAPLVAVSPDGRRVAYVARTLASTQICLRRLDEYAAEPIKGTEAGVGPFFSPDGEWLGFESGGELKKVRLRDGLIVPICSGATRMHGASWHANGSIVFGASNENGMGLSLVSAEGGEPRSFLLPHASDGAPDETYLAYPSWVPDGSAVIFTALRYNHEALRLSIRSVDGRERRVLVEAAGNGSVLPTGHLLFSRNNGLSAVAFDPRTRTVRGSAVPLLQDAYHDSTEIALVHHGLSRDGALVYVRGPAAASAPDLVWADRSGRVDASVGSAVRARASEIPMVYGPTFSPDGRGFLFWSTVFSTLGRPPRLDLWIQSLSRNTLAKFPVPANIAWSVWTPDGRHLVLEIADDTVVTASLFMARADGVGAPDRLTTARSGRWQNPLAFTPDGATLVYQESEKGADYDLWALPMAGGREPRPLFVSRTENEFLAALSPDGRWLAYVSTATGRPEVYVTDFPGLSGRHQVSTGGGYAPKWSPDRRELFFTDGRSESQLTLYAADVSQIGRGVIGTPAELFSGPYHSRPYGPNYDITPDGARFLFVRSPVVEAPSSLAVVVNWFDEVRAAFPASK